MTPPGRIQKVVWFQCLVLLLCFVSAGLALLAETGNEGGRGKEGPEELMHSIFLPLEKTMGIKIVASKFAVGLLSGKASLPSLVLEHPLHGKFAVVRNAQFALGLALLSTPPEKATITIDNIEVRLDVGRGKFWNKGTSDGKPIPGSPHLKAGRINFKSAHLKLRHNDSNPLVIEGAEAILRDVNIPAEYWSRGEAPKGVWAKAELKGGAIYLEGLPAKGALGEIDLYFNSQAMHIKSLRFEVPGRGKVEVKGVVDCTGGEPTKYDLLVSLSEFKLVPNLEETASYGTLKIRGKKGNVSIKGKLEAKSLVAKSWDFSGCGPTPKLKIEVMAENGTKKKKKTRLGVISGSLCKGKMTPSL